MAIFHQTFFTLVLCFLSSLPFICPLSTVSISQAGNQTLVCALIPSSKQQSHLNCTSFPEGIPIRVSPSFTSFSAIVGGNGFLCALRSSSSSTSIVFCWRFSSNVTNMAHKRIYDGPILEELDAGNSHICGLVSRTKRLECWHWKEFNSTSNSLITSSVAVAENFVCGLLRSGKIQCLGSFANVIDHVPAGIFTVVAAGFRHACAISLTGTLECWGDMAGVKPSGQFKSLALAENRSCALRRPNGTVACWGENNFDLPIYLQQTSFISLEAKGNIFCGVATSNYSLFCWGNDEILDSKSTVFNSIIPGPCRKQCPCELLPNYGSYCSQGQVICQPCSIFLSSDKNPAPELAPSSPSPLLPVPRMNTKSSSQWNKKLVAFLVVGCIGSLSFLIVLCFLFYKHCKNKASRVHDSGPMDDPARAPQSSQQQAPPALEKKLSHLISLGNGNRLEEFSLEVLLRATNNFSEKHKIGTGSFGSVYMGTLDDGLEVAIKRAEISSCSSYHHAGGTKRSQEDKDYAFLHELEFLSRLNHRNLVRLLGYSEDCNERVLVYEYLDNGTLFDHIHKLENSPLMSWAARIKVALDAARGIQYLHEYAVPPIIHRDIKSSNILLDATWTAKVSDFGLSLMGPPDDVSYLSMSAAGTVGYMDPEYYRLQQLTTKSDVYSFGVVLLELLSGCKAIHKNKNEVPRNVVDFVVPYIVQDEIHRVLDQRMPPPTPFEIEAVAYVGYLAADCVRLEGRDRPTMTEIVNSLERALAACLATPRLSRSSTGSSV
ncbi:serine/threonine-protein kinase-like protein CCR4 [Coffea arabica]|uniref:Serine/threonine-protein kinase-like protein CCR4 n=1 Tax=Coffea arabica TaxID=13443 RepID=A0A6P6ULW9_COFAR